METFSRRWQKKHFFGLPGSLNFRGSTNVGISKNEHKTQSKRDIFVCTVAVVVVVMGNGQLYFSHSLFLQVVCSLGWTATSTQDGDRKNIFLVYQAAWISEALPMLASAKTNTKHRAREIFLFVLLPWLLSSWEMVLQLVGRCNVEHEVIIRSLSSQVLKCPQKTA